MYPRIPWVLVVDPLGSVEHTLGTTDLGNHTLELGIVLIIFQLLLWKHSFKWGLPVMYPKMVQIQACILIPCIQMLRFTH